MRTEEAPCSFLSIDAETLGERPLDDAERASLVNDPERRRRLDEHRHRQDEFLRRFPSFASLSAATRESQPRSTKARLRLRFALVPVVAAAVLGAVVLLPKHEPHEGQADERIKGTPLIPLEMAVVREGTAHPFVGQAVREGDKLIFRTRTAVDYLSIFSLEASGRVQAIVTAHDNESMSLAVHLPPDAPCPQGVEIDGYAGRERIIAIASAVPLPAERIAEWLRTSFAAMTPLARATLALGPPPFVAQVTTWLLDKDKTP